MIRFLLRFIGLSLLALAFIFLIYDGIRSISSGGILLTKASYVWNACKLRSIWTPVMYTPFGVIETDC